MRQQRIQWTAIQKLSRAAGGATDLKIFSFVLLFLTALLSITPLSAQQKDTAAVNSSSNEDNFFNRMLDYSRPNKNHQLLANLVGTWSFKGRRFPLPPDSSKMKFDFFGSFERKSFAEGRYFIVDMTFGDASHKIAIPVANGKMKDVLGKGLAIEGYDNVKQRFVKTSITNHIGSDIVFWEGTYDPTTKTITFSTVEEIVPGMKTKLRELFIIHDKDHYTVENYAEDGGRYLKNGEVNFTRVK